MQCSPGEKREFCKNKFSIPGTEPAVLSPRTSGKFQWCPVYSLWFEAGVILLTQFSGGLNPCRRHVAWRSRTRAIETRERAPQVEEIERF
jgi:hypothetical protein